MAQAAAPSFEIPEHHRTTTGQPHRKILMWTFLGSECMFFASLIATFLIYRNNVGDGPTRAEVLSSLNLVSMMAFVLLLSSFTMVLGLAAARRGDQKGMTLWLLVTAFFGLFFVGAQGYEFWSFVNHHHLTPRTNLFGASFMTLTGFHGAHVSAGVIWLLGVVLLVRLDPRTRRRPLRASILPRFLQFLSGVPSRTEDERVEVKPRHRRYAAFVESAAPQATLAVSPPAAAAMAEAAWEEQRVREERILNVEIVGLYWHFVDVVWVVIFAVVYLMQA